MRQYVRNQRQKHRDEHVAEHQPVERQVKRIESEVFAELGILDPEVCAVQVQLDPHPVALRDGAGQQADRGRDSKAYQS